MNCFEPVVQAAGAQNSEKEGGDSGGSGSQEAFLQEEKWSWSLRSRIQKGRAGWGPEDIPQGALAQG